MNYHSPRVGVMTHSRDGEPACPHSVRGLCLKVRFDGSVTVMMSLTGFSPVHLAAGLHDC